MVLVPLGTPIVLSPNSDEKRKRGALICRSLLVSLGAAKAGLEAAAEPGSVGDKVSRGSLVGGEAEDGVCATGSDAV